MPPEGGLEVPGILGSLTWRRAAQHSGCRLQGHGAVGNTFSGDPACYVKQGRVETGRLLPMNCLLVYPLLSRGPLQGVCCDCETHRSQ